MKLRVLRGGEDARRVRNLHSVVARRVHHEEGAAQLRDSRREVLLLGVEQELPLDRERPAGERHLRFAVGLDLREALAEEVAHMAHIARRADRHHRPALGYRCRRREDRRAAEAVADKQRWRLISLTQMCGGSEQVGDVGGEVGIGEFAFARAEAGEVEAQAGDAMRRELLRNARRGEDVLAAGEAVREEREGRRRGVGRVEARGEALAAAAGKRDARELQIITTLAPNCETTSNAFRGSAI